jgi:hypothetical protein
MNREQEIGLSGHPSSISTTGRVLHLTLPRTPAVMHCRTEYHPEQSTSRHATMNPTLGCTLSMQMTPNGRYLQKKLEMWELEVFAGSRLAMKIQRTNPTQLEEAFLVASNNNKHETNWLKQVKLSLEYFDRHEICIEPEVHHASILRAERKKHRIE